MFSAIICSSASNPRRGRNHRHPHEAQTPGNDRPRRDRGHSHSDQLFAERRTQSRPSEREPNDMIAAMALILFGVYLACGFVFALPFAFLGVGRIDPHASPGSWGFRLLIIPGATALWPILLLRS